MVVTIASTHYAYPLRDGQPGLAWVAWLNTETAYPWTVTHLSTNLARRRVTSLISPTTLPLSQTATLSSNLDGYNLLAVHVTECGSTHYGVLSGLTCDSASQITWIITEAKNMKLTVATSGELLWKNLVLKLPQCLGCRMFWTPQTLKLIVPLQDRLHSDTQFQNYVRCLNICWFVL